MQAYVDSWRLMEIHGESWRLMLKTMECFVMKNILMEYNVFNRMD